MSEDEEENLAGRRARTASEAGLPWGHAYLPSPGTAGSEAERLARRA